MVLGNYLVSLSSNQYKQAVFCYRKHELLDEDIAAHEDRIKDLNAQCEEFLNNDAPVGGDKDEMRERRDSINTRFANVKVQHM